MRILIAAGGTGGHIFPAMVLADEVKTGGIGKVLFVTSSRRQDTQILNGKDIDFYTLPIIAVKSKGIFSILNFAIRLLAGTIKSFFILIRFKPDIVVGFGGYVSGPIVLIAGLLGIKTIIHEQNVYPGKANRILARFADRIAISFPETRDYLKRYETKIVLAGNPIRKGLIEPFVQKDLQEDHFVVLVMGGSQGAHILNDLVPKALGLMPGHKKSQLDVIHISGDKERDAVIDAYKRIHVQSNVFFFTEDMGRIYNRCDFVISRAGAMTVSELLALAKPCILIPYPYAGAHQLFNAMVLKKTGGAVLLEEDGISPEKLKDTIIELMDTDVLKGMADKIKTFKMPDARDVLVNMILELLSEVR